MSAEVMHLEAVESKEILADSMMVLSLPLILDGNIWLHQGLRKYQEYRTEV